MPAANKKNKSNTPLVVAIILIVIVAVVGLALYIGSNTQGGSSNTAYMDLPVITTPMVRPSTGEEFNVQTLFSIRIDRAVLDDVTDEELTEDLSEIMLEMDIERVLGEGKVQYISDRATELLNARLTDRGINTRVLVVDIATNDRITLVNPAPGGHSSEVMRGLFQNVD
jgi:flagellar basal body-associated protein FliL